MSKIGSRICNRSTTAASATNTNEIIQRNWGFFTNGRETINFDCLRKNMQNFTVKMRKSNHALCPFNQQKQQCKQKHQHNIVFFKASSTKTNNDNSLLRTNFLRRSEMPKLRTNSSSSLSSASSGGGGGGSIGNSSGLSCGNNGFCFVVDSNSDLQSPSVVVANNDSLKFEQKRRLSSATTTSSSSSSSSSSSLLKNKILSEKSELSSMIETKLVHQPHSDYRENNPSAGSLSSLLTRPQPPFLEQMTSEKNHLHKQEQRSVISSGGELNQQQEIQNTAAERTLKMKSDLSSFSSKKLFSSTSSSSSSSQSNISYTISSSSKTSSSQLNGLKNLKADDEPQVVQQPQQPPAAPQNSSILDHDLSDLQDLNRKTTCPQDIKNTMQKYVNELDACIRAIGKSGEKTVASSTLQYMDEMLEKAWAVPAYGYDFGSRLCDTMRTSGGLDMLISNCADRNDDLQMISAKMLSQCLTAENCDYVVAHGLDKVVNAACGFTRSSAGPVTCRRVATEILENLFKHSEEACSNVIKLGGLDSVLYECRKKDVETLRNCAGALANLSLYGGGENHVAMIEREVPSWLFPLAFHTDDNVKYYACLAITALAADSEIEGAVLRSGTLDLVEPFVTRNSPLEFARTCAENARGKSAGWLRRLVPVLASSRVEARNLAAFHFCMEAGIKKDQCRVDVFYEIGAVPALRAVASCPNATASRLAAQALRIIGEPVPHTLSQQVPVWTIDDVREWVTQIGFSEYAANFVESSVDGDLLLQLSEDDLKNDIGLTNGIKRRRFTRELKNLKKIADYTCKDHTNMNTLLQHIHIDFSMYTYNMLNAGVDCGLLPNLREDQLEKECGIANSIHRLKIMEFVNSLDCFYHVGSTGVSGSAGNGTEATSSTADNKNLDVFVSYRRSNGSQLASLLKVHLQIRGFTVFLDVERLEAGKFDNNLLKNIKQAKNFLLVLTPQALERCVNDQDGKDWVHREIVAALQAKCNIIPIIDNFQWPEPEQLPEDMRSVCHFNGVKWIHDYQDACVDKVERFMRGELNSRIEMMLNKNPKNGELTPTLSTPTSASTTTPLFAATTTATSVNVPTATPANRQNGQTSFTAAAAAAAIANNKLFFDNETLTNGFLSKAIVN